MIRKGESLVNNDKNAFLAAKAVRKREKEMNDLKERINRLEQIVKQLLEKNK